MRQYSSIFRQALRITWRERRLWLFALATTWLGTVGDAEIVRRSLDLGDPGILLRVGRGVASTGVLTVRGLAAALAAVRQSPLAVAQVVFVLAGLTLLLVGLTWLAVVAEGTLVHGLAHAEAGRPLRLRAGWTVGRRKFWPLLLLHLSVKALVAAAFFLLWRVRALPLGVFAPLFIVVCLAVLGLFVVQKFAAAAVVLEDLSALAALRRAGELLARRFPEHVVLLGVLSLATVATVAALLAAVLLAMMPFLLAIGIARLLDFTAGAQLYFILSWLVIAGLAALSAILVTTLQWSAWTVAFIRAATAEAQPRRGG